MSFYAVFLTQKMRSGITTLKLKVQALADEADAAQRNVEYKQWVYGNADAIPHYA